MLKEIPQKIGVQLDRRLREAVFDFGRRSGARSISDAVRTLLLAGIERLAPVESTLLKGGYRAGVNMGLKLVKEKLMGALDDEMSRVDATDDLTASDE